MYANSAFPNLIRFHHEHGPEHLLIDGWIFYPDGATREEDPMGMLMNPPTDEKDLTKHKLIYQKEILRRLTNKFAEMKSELAQQANMAAKTTSTTRMGVSAPTQQQIQELEKLAEKVRKQQIEVKALQEKYDDLVMPREERQRREEFAAETAQAGRDAMNKISEIRV